MSQRLRQRSEISRGRKAILPRSPARARLCLTCRTERPTTRGRRGAQTLTNRRERGKGNNATYPREVKINENSGIAGVIPHKKYILHTSALKRRRLFREAGVKKQTKKLFCQKFHHQ